MPRATLSLPKQQTGNTLKDTSDIISAFAGYMWGAFLPDGKLISACGGHPIGEDNAYITTFHTDQEYRRRGIGKKVWRQCMDNLGDRNFIVIAELAMAPVYNRWGFNIPLSFYISISGTTKIPEAFPAIPGVKLQPISDEKFDDVMMYDESVSLTKRKDVMKAFIISPNTRFATCATNEGRVVGYIVIHHGLTGFQLSVFYAENPNIAKMLMYNAVKQLGEGVYIEGSFYKHNSAQCAPLYEMFGLENIVDYLPSFSTKRTVELPYLKIFATLEHGTSLL